MKNQSKRRLKPTKSLADGFMEKLDVAMKRMIEESRKKSGSEENRPGD